MHPKHLSIKDFTYTLPPERIAEYPVAERDDAKLLVYRNGHLSEDHYRNIATHLSPRSFLLFNDTRVVPARLLFRKPTGGMVELFCLEPGDGYERISSALSQTGSVCWNCLVGGASKWKHGQVLEKIIAGKNNITLQASYVEKKNGGFLVRFSWSPLSLTFAEALQLAGAIPLPPYIKRNAEESDEERYQTVYAQAAGSVAAPTAGLHFTPGLLEELKRQQIDTGFLTLHVGAGTFKPVKSDTMEEHDMHAELIDVPYSLIAQLLSRLDDPLIPVGTTSLRTLESLYWLGVKFSVAGGDPWQFPMLPELHQWEPYDLPQQDVPPATALQALLEWMKKRKMDRLVARTQIIIAPGYRLRLAGGLITNFHQPQSTLLLLIAALLGVEWHGLYDYALEHDFRFLSYGDGCLLLPAV